MVKMLLIICLSLGAGTLFVIGARFFNRVSSYSECPRVSLVFLLENNERDLEWLIRRLMLLRYGNYRSFQVLLVDRGSIDRTPQMADLLARDYDEVNTLKYSRGLIKLHEDICNLQSGHKLLPSGQAVLVENLGGGLNCNLVFKRVKSLLKNSKGKDWDCGPNKNETTDEYDKLRRDDTI